MKPSQISRMVLANCAAAQVTVPNVPSVWDWLNQAKDELVRAMEEISSGLFMFRRDYVVAAGDTSVILPDDSDAQYPAFIRLKSVHERTAKGDEIKFDIVAASDVHEHTANPTAVYHEAGPAGSLLYFSWLTGAIKAMTLRVRYRGAIRDASSDTDVWFASIPVDLASLLIARTTALAMSPMKGIRRNRDWERYQGEWQDGLRKLQDASPVDGYSKRIRMDPASPYAAGHI